MRVGDKIKITNGKYSEIYVAVSTSPIGLTLKRLCIPKSKADANRLANNIVIENISEIVRQL